MTDRSTVNHPFTDFKNADRFVEQHGNDAKFVTGFGWIVWDGSRWKLDTGDLIQERAKDTLRRVMAEAAQDGTMSAEGLRFAMRCQTAKAVAPMLQLAQSDPRIALNPAQLDQHPW